MAARASPTWLPTAASLASSPAFITSANLALDAVAFGPLSHSIGSASSAVFACHQVSATTATAESPTRTTFLTPGTLQHRGGVHALDLAAEDRAVLDRGVEHAGQLQVHTVDLRARDLVRRIEPCQPLAGELPVLRILERHVGRRRELRRGGGDLAVGRAASGRRVRDHAVGGHAFGRPGLSTSPRPPARASSARSRHPCARTPANRGCRGCRRSRNCPRRDCARDSRRASGYSVVTFDQLQSSSSATSWARPVSDPWPISERAMRITTVSSGFTTTHALISGVAAPGAAVDALAPAPRRKRNMEADDERAGGGRRRSEKSAAGEIGRHVVLPSLC